MFKDKSQCKTNGPDEQRSSQQETTATRRRHMAPAAVAADCNTHTNTNTRAHAHTQMNWNAELNWKVFFAPPPKMTEYCMLLGFFFQFSFMLKFCFLPLRIMPSYQDRYFGEFGDVESCFFFSCNFLAPKIFIFIHFDVLPSHIKSNDRMVEVHIIHIMLLSQDVCCWGFFCAIFANVNIMHSTTLSHAKLK